MDIEFTWDRGKAKRNLQKHGISFETAKQVFFDPHLVVVEDCEVDDEMRYQAIGYAGSDLLLVVHVDHSAQKTTRKSFTSCRHEGRPLMSRQHTPINLRKGIKISEKTRQLYDKRDRSLDDDRDSRPLPPEKWAHAMRREEFFRPIKKLTSVRIDADVLAWLRSEGAGHLSRINEILRQHMESELKRSRKNRPA